MLIQPNMSPKEIASVWPETKNTFEKYQIPLSEQVLQRVVEPKGLESLLKELNDLIGSSATT